MDYLKTLWSLLAEMRFRDFLDIAIVAFLIYKLLPVFRTTGTGRIAVAVLAVVTLSSITSLLKLYTLSYLLGALLSVGLIAIVVLYQPELRRMLDHVTHNIKVKSIWNAEKVQSDMVPVIDQTVRACEAMSQSRVGALIVFARENRLDEYFKTGTMLDAQVSEQLIRNVFFPKASLHDGAMIIRDNRITAAGCVLPLSESDRLNADLGTRHRAGVGMSEVSDAVVVIVSEETGVISVAVGGMLKRHLAPQTLERLLRNELCPDDGEKKENIMVKLKQKLKKEKEGDDREA